MTEDHGRYDPDTPADDDVEPIGAILQQLVDRHTWGQPPDHAPPSPPSHDGRHQQPGR